MPYTLLLRTEAIGFPTFGCGLRLSALNFGEAQDFSDSWSGSSIHLPCANTTSTEGLRMSPCPDARRLYFRAPGFQGSGSEILNVWGRCRNIFRKSIRSHRKLEAVTGSGSLTWWRMLGPSTKRAWLWNHTPQTLNLILYAIA